MPINNITQTISTIPEAGHRGVDVQTQFVIKQEDFQDHLQGTTVTELNTLKDQFNSRISEINSTATTMNGYANTASAGASTATTKAGEASTSAGEALSYKNQAETFKNNASASATKASQWADNNYNVEVETGKYSAKHWSTVAQNATANKVDKVTSTDNAIVRFYGTTGAVQNSGVIIKDNGNVGIGASSPGARLQVVGSDTVGGYNNVAGVFGVAIQSELYIGSRNGNNPFIGSGGAYTLSLCTNGSERLTLDSVGKVLVTSPAGLGYGTGAGGTVTQLTSKNTAVTLNKPTGTIICSNSAISPNSRVNFILNNSLIQSGDQIIVNMIYATGTVNSYNVTAEIGSGLALINIWNFSGLTFSEAIQIKFEILKGANA